MSTNAAGAHRLRISSKNRPTMTVYKEAVKAEQLVYFLVTDKEISYNKGRSRIVYIGNTEKGPVRFGRSAARRAEDIFKNRGVRQFQVFTVTCKGSPEIKFCTDLERLFLRVFHEDFAELPKCNKQGAKKTEGVFANFPKKRISQILQNLG